MSVKRKTLEQLCPSALLRAFTGAPNESLKTRKKKKQQDDQSFVPQDLGQYGHLATRHPFLNENSDTYKPEFVKRAISRPMTLTVSKHSDMITCAAFSPAGLTSQKSFLLNC